MEEKMVGSHSFIIRIWVYYTGIFYFGQIMWGVVMGKSLYLLAEL